MPKTLCRRTARYGAHKSPVLLAIGAALALCTATAVAQDQSDARPNGFYLTSPLELSEGYDSGLVAGTTRIYDYESLLTAPTFAWFRNTHRTEFYVDYDPEFEIFAHNSQLDSWNHSSTMRLTHRINSRWSLIAGNSLLSTSDPGRSLGNSLVLLPRGRYLQDSLYGGLNYRINQATKVTVRVDAAVNTIQLPAPLTGQLDNATTALSATLDRSLTSSQSISATYSFLHYSPFHPSLAGGPENVHVVNGVYTYEPEHGLLFRVSGGFIDGTQAALTGAVTVEKTFGRLWTAAGYQRYVGFFAGLNPANGPQPEELSFAGSVTPNDVYQVISFRVRGQIWKRLGGQIIGQKASNTDNDVAGRINSLVGQFRLDYKVNERLSIFARADYYGQNINRFINEPLSERRYFCGLDVILSRSPGSKEKNYSHRTASRATDDLPAAVLDPDNQPPGETQQ